MNSQNWVYIAHIAIHCADDVEFLHGTRKAIRLHVSWSFRHLSRRDIRGGKAIHFVLIAWKKLKNFTVTKTLHKHAHEQSNVHNVLLYTFSDYGMDSLSGMAVFFVRALERASIKDRETARPAPSIKRSLIGIASFFPTRNIRANLSSRILFAPVFFSFFEFCFIVLQEKNTED